MNRPFFSIAVPTFNRSENLKIALGFIIKQTYKNFEIIVSDNASTDNTREVVSSFKDKRIKYYKNLKHTGVIENERKSINKSSGKYVFLHSDDDYLYKENSLEEIFKTIKKTKAGYVRVNYLSISPDKNKVFDFRASKGFSKDAYIGKKMSNQKILNFILKSDPSFISGTIFKNEKEPKEKIINSDLYSWFPAVYENTKKYGGCYLNTPYILASWSEWRTDGLNPLYSLVNGELSAENFFKYVKKELKDGSFINFMNKMLNGVYVSRFVPAKLFVGNKNLIKLSKRVIYLNPMFKTDPVFWRNLFLALIIPKVILKMIRKIYLYNYINKNKYSDSEIQNTLARLNEKK